MSRIILSKYDNGEQRFVVGWDHPAGGAFWQEFNREPDPDPESGEVDWMSPENEDWQEVLRDGGMWPGIPLDKFHEDVPEDLRPLVTPEVMALLSAHQWDVNSGRVGAIDLSGAAR